MARTSKEKKIAENLEKLANVLKTAKDVVEREWKRLSPERKRRMCENIVRRVNERIEKRKGNRI